MSHFPSLSLAFLLLLCAYSSSAQPGRAGMMENEDQEILEKVFALHSGGPEVPISELMIEVARFFLGSPYVAFTLEKEPEELVVNLREFDCTTFAESCLAISRCILSGQTDLEHFLSELKEIRYRDGEIQGYASRIHYFSDWIFTNNQKQIVRDFSREIGGSPLPARINFMSTHPGSYRQLASDAELIGIIAAQEKEISTRAMFFIPAKLIKNLEHLLKEGDIIGLTTDIPGLDIIHVGILVRKSKRIHLIHASSRAKRVIISEETLEAYLESSKNVTGIMIARPL